MSGILRNELESGCATASTASVWVEQKEDLLDPQGRDILDVLARQGPQLHALLVRLTLREDVAEELMQELFLRLCRSEGFARAEDRAAYACRTATHLAFDWRRTRSRKPPMAYLQVEPVGDTPPALNRLIDAEETERVLDAVSRLDAPYREAFVMRWVEQKSYEAIAPRLKRTPHQVRGLCHKALQQLRTWFAGKSEESHGKEDCHVDV